MRRASLSLYSALGKEKERGGSFRISFHLPSFVSLDRNRFESDYDARRALYGYNIDWLETLRRHNRSRIDPKLLRSKPPSNVRSDSTLYVRFIFYRIHITRGQVAFVGILPWKASKLSDVSRRYSTVSINTIRVYN